VLIRFEPFPRPCAFAYERVFGMTRRFAALERSAGMAADTDVTAPLSGLLGKHK